MNADHTPRDGDSVLPVAPRLPSPTFRDMTLEEVDQEITRTAARIGTFAEEFGDGRIVLSFEWKPRSDNPQQPGGHTSVTIRRVGPLNSLCLETEDETWVAGDPAEATRIVTRTILTPERYAALPSRPQMNAAPQPASGAPAAEANMGRISYAQFGGPYSTKEIADDEIDGELQRLLRASTRTLSAVWSDGRQVRLTQQPDGTVEVERFVPCDAYWICEECGYTQATSFVRCPQCGEDDMIQSLSHRWEQSHYAYGERPASISVPPRTR